MCTYRLALKDGAKVDFVHVASFRQCSNELGIAFNFRWYAVGSADNGQERQNPDSGIVGLGSDEGKYGGIKGDTRLFSDGCECAKTEKEELEKRKNEGKNRNVNFVEVKIFR